MANDLGDDSRYIFHLEQTTVSVLWNHPDFKDWHFVLLFQPVPDRGKALNFGWIYFEPKELNKKYYVVDSE